jgi:hypothetical protein|tara:strand:+ start:287 stop:685 length:399 start_codon:yes stop_codon:yes gene_type:complete
MPWSRDVSDGTHVLLARLAHYVDQYSEKHREEVLSLISKDTLRRYRDYERALDGSDSDHKNFGPRRLDLFLRIVSVFGHEPATVLRAAIVSRSPEEMAFLIAHGQPCEPPVPPALTPIVQARHGLESRAANA